VRWSRYSLSQITSRDGWAPAAPPPAYVGAVRIATPSPCGPAELLREPLVEVVEGFQAVAEPCSCAGDAVRSAAR
jgi:hypothetical protein